jgi:NADPH:quinone reductase
MRAVEITHPGGPEVLQPCVRPVPQAGAGEVLIRVTASGVNRPDVLQRKGLYPMPPGVSDLPGLEVAGVIVDGDPAAMAQSDLVVGQRVSALLAGGGYAEFAVAPAAQCLPVPESWTDVEAAALPETLYTVWQNVFANSKLQAGERLLVHGGSSGIGVMAIQMAKAFGAQVAVTAGSDAKCQACLELGADQAFNYRQGTWADQVLAWSDGRGVDVVLDMVGGAYLPQDLACLAEDGRLSLIAIQGGRMAELDSAMILRKRLSIAGSTLRPRSLAYKAELTRQIRDKVWPHLVSGRVKPVVHAVLPLADAAKAHELMESGAHIGKIVLNVGDVT